MNSFYPDPKWVLSIFKFNNLFLHEQLDVCWTDGEGKDYCFMGIGIEVFFFYYLLWNCMFRNYEKCSPILLSKWIKLKKQRRRSTNEPQMVSPLVQNEYPSITLVNEILGKVRVPSISPG